MKYILIVAIFLLTSFQSLAQEPLTKEFVQKYFSTIGKLQTLDMKYPNIDQEMESLMQLTPEAALQKIEGLDAYNDIEKLVKSAGYDNFEQFYKQSYRIMASMFAVQMQHMPQGGGSIKETIENTIAEMKKSGMPDEAIAELTKEMSEQQSYFESMEKISKNASKKDIDFMKDNMMWIMSLMPQNN